MVLSPNFSRGYSYFANTQCFPNLKYITVEGEDIRPSFEMYFQNNLSSKIFKIDKIF